jgi:hypothetical protein
MPSLAAIGPGGFIFGDRRASTYAPAQSGEAATPAASTTPNPPTPRRGVSGRSTAINVVELFVVDGKLLPGDPDKPTRIDLKSVREQEK